LALSGRYFDVTATSTTPPGTPDYVLSNNDTYQIGNVNITTACCTNRLPLVPYIIRSYELGNGSQSQALTSSDILSGDTSAYFVDNLSSVYNDIVYGNQGALQPQLVNAGLCNTTFSTYVGSKFN